MAFSNRIIGNKIGLIFQRGAAYSKIRISLIFFIYLIRVHKCVWQNYQLLTFVFFLSQTTHPQSFGCFFHKKNHFSLIIQKRNKTDTEKIEVFRQKKRKCHVYFLSSDWHIRNMWNPYKSCIYTHYKGENTFRKQFPK